MNKTLEGMARVASDAFEHSEGDNEQAWYESINEAVLFLARNVTDEMVNAYHDHGTESVRHCLAAALRAAAEG